jgi:hypothetical protein
MNDDSDVFFKLAKHPLKFPLYLLEKLPSAFFSGVRVKEADKARCIVTVRHGWFTQNPFRSTYFACLAMAAEMSTGILVLAHIYRRVPSVSLLVIKMEAQFFKKAMGKTRFLCEDGKLIQEAVEKAISTGDAQTVTAKSMGTSQAGDQVAEFLITWSFKSRSVRE